MKLGIVSVFMPKPEDADLVQLYFDQFQKTTKVDYTIYCHVDKAAPEFQKQISSQPKVKTVSIPETDLTGFREHSYYLTGLIKQARKECSHIAVFHPDSFPVKDGWTTSLETKSVVAIKRVENNDHKPHSCFMLLTSEFLERYEPELLVDKQNSDYQDYYDYCGHLIPDTGSGVGYCLYRNELEWQALTRSNVVNDHWMLGGIYGDTIFHLGTAARTNKILQGDRQKHADKKFLRKTILPKNIEDYENIRKKLLADPEGYFSYLRGA